jgi:hypothetical protein
MDVLPFTALDLQKLQLFLVPTEHMRSRYLAKKIAAVQLMDPGSKILLPEDDISRTKSTATTSEAGGRARTSSPNCQHQLCSRKLPGMESVRLDFPLNC